MTRTYRVLVVPGGPYAFTVTVIRDTWRGRERTGKQLSKERVLTWSDLGNAMARAARTMVLDQSSSDDAPRADRAGDQEEPALSAGQPIG